MAAVSLAMATGGGKTKTALIAATEMQDRDTGHLCVAILAPTRPLIRQWTAEVKAFGIEPIVLAGMSPNSRRLELERRFSSVYIKSGKNRSFSADQLLYLRRKILWNDVGC